MDNMWRFDITTDGSLTACEKLINLPLSINFDIGKEIATCVHEGTREDAELARELVHTAGFVTSDPFPVLEENWVAKCSAMWQPVQAEQIKVTPILDSDHQNLKESDDEIFIVPGSGFGTGHHPSTHAALCLMQDSRISRPQVVLDVGAGSAILSIAAVKLFGATAYAYDVDQNALDNAVSCIALNPNTKKRINLFCSVLPPNARQCDLLLSNIYGEVLIESAPLFIDRTLTGGHIILAGVTSEIAQQVQNTYTSQNCVLLKHLTHEQWNAYLFKRN